MAEFAKYSKIGGRDLESMEQIRRFACGSRKQERSSYRSWPDDLRFSAGFGLHEKLGNLYLDTANTKDAVREFQVLVALNPVTKREPLQSC